MSSAGADAPADAFVDAILGGARSLNDLTHEELIVVAHGLMRVCERQDRALCATFRLAKRGHRMVRAMQVLIGILVGLDVAQLALWGWGP